MNDWRKIPRTDRPYDAYLRGRYVEDECDHNGMYCKCDPPYWLREPTAAERDRWHVSGRVHDGTARDASGAAIRDVLTGEPE